MKTIIKAGFATVILLAISCTKENIKGPYYPVAASADKALVFSIGQQYGGGIIFYIDSTGQHGLIAGRADVKPTLLRWYNGDYTLTGALATAIGTGKTNTKRIIQSQGTGGSYAALACAKYKGGGYTDWYLPSRDELNALYLQRNAVGGFARDFYWSSSEYPTIYAYFSWRQSFDNGLQNYELKYVTYRVRAIRSF